MTRLIFILIISLASTICTQAQTIQYIGAPTTTVISRGNFRTDSIFYLPKRTKAPTDTAAIRYQISDSSVYVWTGSAWRKAGGIDTTSLSNRINLKLNISDTATMLSPYYRSATAGAALALKLNISDTSTMLSPYLRKVDTTAMLSPYYRTATANAALALKLNISDTSTMLGNYVRHAGYGLTKSGQSFLVDTAAMATRARVQKGIDSVVSIIPAAGIGGSGTTNRVMKFTASTTAGNSGIVDSSSAVAMTISPSGNIGIGITTGMGERFNVANSSGNANASIATSNATSGAFLRFGNATNADGLYVGYNNPAGSLLGSIGGANAGVIMGYGSYPIGFGTNATERLRITSSGDILHRGTYNPLSATNRGNIMLNGSASNIIGFSNNSALRGYIFHTDSDFQFYNNTTGGRVGLYTEATARLWIQANGRIGVNTTTDAGYQFDVNGTLRSTSSTDLASSGGEVRIAMADAGAYTLQVGGPAYLAGAANTSLTTSAGLHYMAKGDNTYFTGFNFQGVAASDMFFGRTASSDDIVISTSNTGSPAERVRFKQNGDVGIGTSSPSYKLDINGTLRSVNGANFATTSGNVGIGTASPVGDGTALNIYGSSFATIKLQNSTSGATATDGTDILVASSDLLVKNRESGSIIAYTANTERGRINSAGEWIIDASGTDAGDYKLQVVGNARVGTGKLDIASNTTFGIGVARSGTSEVAGQIYNSNGILYLGAESSAGGQIFTGSSAYAAVIGSGANYPLQFAVNNAVRGGFNTGGELMLNTTSDQGAYVLQANGSVYNTGQVTRGTLNVIGTGAQISTDSTTNLSPIYLSGQSLTGSSAQAMVYGNATWNTTGAPSLIEMSVTNTASGADANYIKITDGSNIFRVTKDAGIITANPTSGTARKWKLGSVVATGVQLDTANYVEVEINGTFYRLAIVTPL